MTSYSPSFLSRHLPGLLSWSLAVLLTGSTWAEPVDVFQREQLPSIPTALGLAGPIAGVSGGALVVGGGANFPNGFPWEGGKKAWHDEIFVLPSGATNWISEQKLPRPIAYAVSLPTRRGILVAGGSDAARHYADCFLLRWNGSRLETETLPSLPSPAANAAGAVIDDTVFIAGGEMTPAATVALTNFWMLNLSGTNSWKALPTWPGPARTLAAAGVQDGRFFLVGGVTLSTGPNDKPSRTYLKDAYSYDPKTAAWHKLADAPHPIAGAPSPLPRVGQSHIFVLGCDDGSKYGFQPVQAHPGFSKEILSYNAFTDTWTPSGTVTVCRVTTTVVNTDRGFVIPAGEIRPGVRSPDVWRYKPTVSKTEH